MLLETGIRDCTHEMELFTSNNCQIRMDYKRYDNIITFSCFKRTPTQIFYNELQTFQIYFIMLLIVLDMYTICC